VVFDTAKQVAWALNYTTNGTALLIASGSLANSGTIAITATQTGGLGAQALTSTCLSTTVSGSEGISDFMIGWMALGVATLFGAASFF
jgi:hypothetical protein